ncbi:MAG TPA: efflux RND transporter periplasmic adaptor subunit [Pseudolabrys sp.]|nr:efflux RND transporter periplasmic adaptor subunit [Pseudolabrys sp.]
MLPETASFKVSRGVLRLAGTAAGLAAIIVVAMGVTTRRMADARLSELTENQAVPVVAVVAPDTKGRRTYIELPGRLEAFAQAQIYARVSGYIKEWKADIGTPVKAGQVLAEIDAPDLDQQIMQAEADLLSAQANAKLSKATLERGQSLITSEAISKSALDTRSADFGSKQGLVSSAQANLDRLRVLEKYKKIVSPFDGLVTARATDVGALINAGNGGGAALFVVSDVGKLRAYVNVPQNSVPQIKVGTKAQLTVPEYAGRTFQATVEASAQAVDQVSGTTRMLLIVDNTSGELMTGAFSTVRLQLALPDAAISIPSSALVFNKDGLRVATVATDGRVMLKTVTVARDLGRQIELSSGITADDRVIANPPDGIASGDAVRIAGQTSSPIDGTPTTLADPAKPKG